MLQYIFTFSFQTQRLNSDAFFIQERHRYRSIVQASHQIVLEETKEAFGLYLIQPYFVLQPL